MSLREELGERLRDRVAVVGVGNPMRGDDAAGCLLARRLRGRCPATVIEAEEVPESYLDAIADARPETVVLVDAVDLGAEPGAVALLESEAIAAYLPSTHRLPLSFLMELIRRRSGADVLLIGIQPLRVGFADGVSPVVAESVDDVAAILSQLLERVAPKGAAGAVPARCVGGIA